MAEVPASIKIPVDTSQCGEAYEGQWVVRKLRVPRATLKEYREIGIKRWASDDKVLKKFAEVLAPMFLDWNLEGDDGPLPKPDGSVGPIIAVAEADINLLSWLGGASVLPLAAVVQPEKN